MGFGLTTRHGLTIAGMPSFQCLAVRELFGNSNERGSKGFMTTFALPRTLGIKEDTGSTGYF